MAADTELADPARRLRDAVEPLAMHSSGSPSVRAALARLGLDRFPAYVWGRAAALGDPTPAQVVAAFGVFEPVSLGLAYDQARSRCPRDVLVKVREAATVHSLRRVLGDPDVGPVVSRLRTAVAAAAQPGRNGLFAALTGQPWPDDPLAQLWRACELVREHRGDLHLAVLTRHRLGPVEGNVLTELWHGFPLGSYTATRGWPADAITAAAGRLTQAGLITSGTLSHRGHELRCRLEAETSCGQQSLTAALGAELDEVVHQLNTWSSACTTAGTFTNDHGKRMAG